jgi:heme o synthase
MKTATAVCADGRAVVRSHVADFVELSKPRLNTLVLFTVAAGFLFAGQRTFDWLLLVHTLVGTALVAAGASALNQLFERDSDAHMHRTEHRPLPAGRLHPAEALIFGVAASVCGLGYLAVSLPRPIAAGVAAVTLVSYVFIYTPLKRRTSLNTLAGAVPGALPPLIGYAAARGTIDLEGLALALILFLWQIPHFLAIAWIYRDDYERGGQRMLPGIDRSGFLTALHMVTYCFALLPASLLPYLLGRAGLIYVAGAITLGSAFLAFSLAFLGDRSEARARDVLRASLIYLPVLLALLLITSQSRASNFELRTSAAVLKPEVRSSKLEARTSLPQLTTHSPLTKRG